jgi:hypothetical protein
MASETCRVLLQLLINILPSCITLVLYIYYVVLCFNCYISLKITLLCKRVISTSLIVSQYQYNFVQEEYSALVNAEASQQAVE